MRGVTQDAGKLGVRVGRRLLHGVQTETCLWIKSFLPPSLEQLRGVPDCGLSLLPSPGGQAGWATCSECASKIPSFPVAAAARSQAGGCRGRGAEGGRLSPGWHPAFPTSSCSPGSHVLLSRELPFDEPLFSLSF